jgi:hypothetical protein
MKVPNVALLQSEAAKLSMAPRKKPLSRNTQTGVTAPTAGGGGTEAKEKWLRASWRGILLEICHITNP